MEKSKQKNTKLQTRYNKVDVALDYGKLSRKLLEERIDKNKKLIKFLEVNFNNFDFDFSSIEKIEGTLRRNPLKYLDDELLYRRSYDTNGKLRCLTLNINPGIPKEVVYYDRQPWFYYDIDKFDNIHKRITDAVAASIVNPDCPKIERCDVTHIRHVGPRPATIIDQLLFFNDVLYMGKHAGSVVKIAPLTYYYEYNNEGKSVMDTIKDGERLICERRMTYDSHGAVVERNAKAYSTDRPSYIINHEYYNNGNIKRTTRKEGGVILDDTNFEYVLDKKGRLYEVIRDSEIVCRITYKD